MLNNTIRADIHIGATVDIVLKKDQPTGILTRGKVAHILTHSPEHWRGIKVRLEDGQVGRVQHIISDAEPMPEAENPFCAAYYLRHRKTPSFSHGDIRWRN